MSEKYTCPVFGRCGGCSSLNLSYEEHLKHKQNYINQLFGELKLVCEPVVPSEPVGYRCKVQMAFAQKDPRHLICGNFEPESHRIVPVENCLLDHPLADEIIGYIKKLCEKFRLSAYDEKRKSGVIRHVMVRIGCHSGEVMVILVTGTSFFPGKQNFIKELRKQFPQITTVVQNINGAFTSKVLGDQFQTVYGPGFIYDSLMDMKFRLSPGAFYQVNPPQAEKLYQKAIEFADLRGDELLLDAYCGTGTIGMIASKHCKEVLGVELNRSAVADARINAKINHVSNIRFVCADAGDYLISESIHPQVVIMDPPRSGSSEEFLHALVKASPEKIVYISCGPDTQVRDIKILMKEGYQPIRLASFDLFPWTDHIETVCCLYHQKKDFVLVPYEPKDVEYLKKIEFEI